MKQFLIPFVFASFVLLPSCGTDVYSSNTNGETQSAPVATVALADDLFSPVSEDGEHFVFETNNTAYLTSKGSTLWTLAKKNASGEVFGKRTVRVVKESGAAHAGFGIVFCVQESETKGSYNMLAVLLNTEGQFAIGKIIKGNYTNIQWWTDSPFINRGYGAVNYICVEYGAESEEFTLRLNGASVLKFSDADSSPRLSYGGDGYVAVLASNENYPAVSTKITFIETDGE